MKKGFTLIELLAVIVILAIIALIATPIVLNIINDTKKSAVLRSADFYINALENEIALENMNQGGNFNPNTCTITDGNVSCDEKELTIKVDGERPISGSITFEAGKVTDVNLTYPSGTVTKNEKGELVFGESKVEVPEPKSFAEDDWSTIVANVRAGNLSKYNVGDTKEIALTGFTNTEANSNGLYTIRIANTTSPAECKTEGFSQTACGFVIEFVDIITTHAMNSTNTNVGGWEKSEMRTYVNNDIYNALPEEIRNSIIDTTVISGHGSTSGENNFATTDKVYLLSTKEVWGKEGTDYQIDYDTAEAETRQLDYYKAEGVTTNSFFGSTKKYNGSASYWWLRSARSDTAHIFYYVTGVGFWGNIANDTNGVAVAFRIG